MYIFCGFPKAFFLGRSSSHHPSYLVISDLLKSSLGSLFSIFGLKKFLEPLKVHKPSDFGSITLLVYRIYDTHSNTSTHDYNTFCSDFSHACGTRSPWVLLRLQNYDTWWKAYTTSLGHGRRLDSDYPSSGIGGRKVARLRATGKPGNYKSFF